MKLSIIVPAFNEEKTIGEMLSKLISLNIGSIDKEIIVVNDGSTDSTGQIIEKIKKYNQSLIVIDHVKNKGKGAAVRTGFTSATGDILIIQDADLEYNPNDIPKIIKPIVEKNARVVYGTRLKIKPILFGKNKTPLLLHFFGNKFLSLVTTALYGYPISDMETCYKAFEKNVIKGMRLRSRSFNFEPEITAKILKKGIRILEIPIKNKPRGFDEGKKLRTFHDGGIALWTLLKYRFKN